MGKFIKGMDLSTMLEVEQCGAKYFVDGQEMVVACGTCSADDRLGGVVGGIRRFIVTGCQSAHAQNQRQQKSNEFLCVHFVFLLGF